MHFRFWRKVEQVLSQIKVFLTEHVGVLHLWTVDHAPRCKKGISVDLVHVDVMIQMQGKVFFVWRGFGSAETGY